METKGLGREINAKNISIKLKEYMVSNGLNRSGVYNKVKDVASKQTVYNLIDGTRNSVRVDTVFRIERVLGITLLPKEEQIFDFDHFLKKVECSGANILAEYDNTKEMLIIEFGVDPIEFFDRHILPSEFLQNEMAKVFNIEVDELFKIVGKTESEYKLKKRAINTEEPIDYDALIREIKRLPIQQQNLLINMVADMGMMKNKVLPSDKKEEPQND